MVMEIVALGMVPKCLEIGLEQMEIRGRIEIPSRLQLCCDWPKYEENFWIPKGTCCHSDRSENPPVKAGGKNSQGVKKKK